MTENPNKGIIAIIRKILARTTDNGCTEAESTAAFAHAARKMAEHNLTMEDMAGTKATEESWLQEDIGTSGRWLLEDNLRYGILKNYFFVECFRRPEGNGQKTLVVFGTPENVAVARHVWDALGNAFDYHWLVYRTIAGLSASEKRLFVMGMADGFTQRLKEERAAQVIERDLCRGFDATGGPGTALALTSIADKLQLAFKAAIGKTKNGTSRFAATEGSQSTLEAGRAAGRSLNLNRGIGAAAAQTITGKSNEFGSVHGSA